MSTKPKSFSMNGGILSTVVRLYSNLDRGNQLHSMCKHKVETASENFLKLVNNSQWLSCQEGVVPMKVEYLRSLVKLIGTMVETLPQNFYPMNLSSDEAIEFIVGKCCHCYCYCYCYCYCCSCFLVLQKTSNSRRH